MKKKFFIFILIIAVLAAGAWETYRGILWYQKIKISQARNQAIESILKAHHDKLNSDSNTTDPFGKDNIVNVLLIGLDQRAGSQEGHCDAIQMITINKKTSTVIITAVPRGTYSPLPYGMGKQPSDYYVSNACGLGGLEYGINQIEKILGQKADYIVTVGFSETLGILRQLKLPTTETLQWLRQRHVYAIGEPQRAHDHSTFLKYLLQNYLPEKDSKIDDVMQYIIYKTVQTDLSLSQSKQLVNELAKMELTTNPERIQLAMKPAFIVQDIPYAPEELQKYLDTTLSRLPGMLSTNDYANQSLEETQKKLLSMIDEKKNDPVFTTWAFENNLWLQIEDHNTRMSIQFDLMKKYSSNLKTSEEKQNLIADYILEMVNRNEIDWETKARELLNNELNNQ